MQELIGLVYIVHLLRVYYIHIRTKFVLNI